MTTLELSDDELIALMAVVGVGMNTCLGRPPGEHLDALKRTPKPVLDGLVLKFTTAATAMLDRAKKNPAAFFRAGLQGSPITSSGERCRGSREQAENGEIAKPKNGRNPSH